MAFGVQVGIWNIGNVSGNGGEVCEVLTQRMIDVCCLSEVRWRGQGVRMLWIEEQRYKLWWSGKGDRVGGVGVLVKGLLCKHVVKITGVCQFLKRMS